MARNNSALKHKRSKVLFVRQINLKSKPEFFCFVPIAYRSQGFLLVWSEGYLGYGVSGSWYNPRSLKVPSNTATAGLIGETLRRGGFESYGGQMALLRRRVLGRVLFQVQRQEGYWVFRPTCFP
jgi:hypothetical protein